jgi:DNA repair exonuclease SbcCD ATPase subunit
LLQIIKNNMLTLHSNVLKNIACFKSAKVYFDKKPLTFVRGLNLDSDPANPTSNGAGKSLLFSCVPNVFYFSPPTALKKNSKKELIKKGSENIIEFTTTDGNKYTITQVAGKYKIEENGIDLEYPTIPKAEKFIRSIFPLSEIDYYTYCYVSTQRPYLMQVDSDINRLDHLTTIFRLDSYDQMKAYFAKGLADVKSNEVRLGIIEQRILEHKAKLKKLQESQGKSFSNKKALSRKIKSLEETLELGNKRIYRLTKTINTLRTLKNVEKELDELRAQYTYKKKPEDIYNDLIKDRKLTRSYDAYLKAKKVYKKTISITKEKLEKIRLPSSSKKEIEKEIIVYIKTISKVEQELDNLKDLQKTLIRQGKIVNSIERDLSEFSIDISKVKPDKDYESSLAECMSKLKLKSLLQHEHLEEGVCPVCLSSIDIENIRKVVADAKKQFPRLKEYKEAQSLLKKLSIEKKNLAKIKFSEKDLIETENYLEALNEDRESYKKDLQNIIRYNELKQTLEDIDEPIEPKKPVLNLDIDTLDEHIELCSNIMKHLEAKTRLLESDSSLKSCKTVALVSKMLEEKNTLLKEIEKEVLSIRKELSKATNDFEQLSLLSSELQVTKTNLEELQKQALELKPSVEDKKVLETLVKAYSTKGLKTLAANSICNLLETNLNTYSNLIFMEPFTFSVKVTETGMSIIVDRQNGAISDVRNLSGAESNSFRLLFVLSILTLIPDERRINMLVLDEPSSHQDEVSREVFLTKYLPILQEVVPNIFIITPNISDYVKGSSLLIVKKEQGVSTVCKKL